jgi:1,4-dihydroxy-2-naphthoyl-CoA hydrolase
MTRRVGFAESDTRTDYPWAATPPGPGRRSGTPLGTTTGGTVTDTSSTDADREPTTAPPADPSGRSVHEVGALAAKMGIRVSEVSAERAVGTMPVEGNTQPVGLLHGGAFVVLAESLGSMAATAHAGPGRIAVGIELNASHSRSARTGVVTGTCSALHLGRTLTTHEVVLTDDEGRRLSTVRITNFLRDR